MCFFFDLLLSFKRSIFISWNWCWWIYVLFCFRFAKCVFHYTIMVDSSSLYYSVPFSFLFFFKKKRLFCCWVYDICMMLFLLFLEYIERFLWGYLRSKWDEVLCSYHLDQRSVLSLISWCFLLHHFKVGFIFSPNKSLIKNLFFN